MNKVHIEFQRVQTWLFSVPRLRAMVGANTLLGEVLRITLPDLARQSGGWSLAPAAGDYPVAEPNDPLKDHDDPAADARQGILARDGGHFEAVFSSGADAFAAAAATMLHRELPGLRFRVSVDGAQRDQAFTALSTELPVFAPCEWTGRGLASITVRQGNDRANVGLDVSRRHEAARRAEGGKAADLTSLLATRTKLERLSRPSTFEALAGDGYLAVIHADGNGVGGAGGSDDVARAGFFHGNRVLLRRALQVAVDKACEKADTAPLLPLMLGGDDLLLLCNAAMALPFVVELCTELERLQADRGEAFHLTLGVGVVFSRPKVPFHRLHEVAENLATSAKRRYRGFSEGDRTPKSRISSVSPLLNKTPMPFSSVGSVSGKVILAIALGHTACLKGYSVLFTTAIDIINTLSAAQTTSTLKRELRKYLKPKLLLIGQVSALVEHLFDIDVTKFQR